MANTKYILEQIRIEGELKELLAKTDGDNTTVTYNGKSMTLTAALASILGSLTDLPADQGVNGGAPETYDTLKEIADYIAEHKDAADALSAAIGQKASAADLTAAVERIAALEDGTHSHANQAVLDGITQAKVSSWDGLRGVRYGAEPPADMKDGELFVRVVSGE